MPLVYKGGYGIETTKKPSITKLTPKAAYAIYYGYWTDHKTMRSLADKHRISLTQVWRICHHYQWDHIHD